MYPGMQVNWHEIIKTKINSTDIESLPVFMAVFSSDKGPETLTDLIADDFFKLYGKTADFFKYGQPLMQAHTILNAGARILGYRLCAEDATLANVVICATVTEDFEGEDGSSSTSPDGSLGEGEVDPFANPFASIKYSAVTVEGAKTFAEILEQVNTMNLGDAIPLFVIADNGRGKSVKKIKITTDYSASKGLTYAMYVLTELENNVENEYTKFSINADAKFSTKGVARSMNLIEGSSVQLKTQSLTENIKRFLKQISDITGYSEAELLDNDVLFGCTRRGVALKNIKIDKTGLNLSSTYGIELQSGTNGAFGDAPFPGETCTDAWAERAAAYFNGDIIDDIWDRDLYKIDFICDANYPDIVKDKIGYFAHWRKDCYYFRDLGLDVWTYDDIYNKVTPDEWRKSPFMGDYLSTYEMIDPNSRKQIRVTMVHGLAPLLVPYYATNLAAPIAGEFNNMVITEAIEGTLNFAPKITPKVNQKEDLEDLRVNYCSIQRNPSRLVVQALYTSHSKHGGPLEKASNVIITQMAVKAIRAYTPKIRFQLFDGYDFSAYKQLIDDNVLSNFKKYFSSVELIYEQDDDESEEGIFSASIECYYKKYVKSEIFDVFAIDGVPDDDMSKYTSEVIDIE